MSDVVKIRRQNIVPGERIGVGGFSTVFKVIWQRSEGDIVVAAKRLNEIDKCEQEILSRLKHRHIVELLGVVDEAMDFFLILELCEGGSLRSYLDKQPNKLPLGQLLEWTEQAALPIQYLNQNNIVHKDIKAANYLFAKGDILKLCDFGLAKNVDKTQSNATSRGTWAWMAPELLKDGTLSITFDIYAYGMTVWELVTTQVPFKDQEYQWIVFRVCKDKKRPPIPSDCAKEVKALIEHCWHQDRHKRPHINQVVTTVRTIKEDYLLSQSSDNGISPQPSIAPLRLSRSAPETSSASRFPTQQVMRQRSSISELSSRTSTSTSTFAPTEIPTLHRYLSLSTSSWVSETRFGHVGEGSLSDARGVAVNSVNAFIVVADRDRARANVYDSEGHFQFPLSTKNGLKRGQISHPHDVAVSVDGNTYFVTDGTSKVKEFGDRGAFLGTFSAIAPNLGVDVGNEPAQLAGLAIDGKGLLLVGVANKKYISQHTTDKTHAHIRSIRINIEPFSIAATSENRIIVSSYKSKKVQLLSEEGILLNTFLPSDPLAKSRWSPYGVCCNRFLLLVCNWATDKNRGVHFFSLDGQYFGCIIPSSYCPRGIALVECDDKLLVTEVAGIGPSQGLKVYRRK